MNTAFLLILQLAILFIPGIIWAGLESKYALKVKLTDTEFVIRAFLFGVSTYLVTFFLYTLFGFNFEFANLSEASTKFILRSEHIKEIFCATLVGIMMAIIWLYAERYKWLTLLLQKINATRKFGDEDVWDFTLNSGLINFEYIHFRDFSQKMVYCGWVNTFSETEKLRELLLRNVEAYDFEGNKLFEVPFLYIAREPQNIHIEFPYQSERKEHSNDGK